MDSPTGLVYVYNIGYVGKYIPTYAAYVDKSLLRR